MTSESRTRGRGLNRRREQVRRLLDRLGSLLATVKRVLEPMSDLRITIVLLLLGAIIVLFVDPGRDVVRGLSDSANAALGDGEVTRVGWPAIGLWFAFWLACIWTGVNAWYWANILYKTRHGSEQPIWFTALRRTLGVAPLTCALFSIALTADPVGDSWFALIWFGASILLLLAFFVVRTRLASSRKARAFTEPIGELGPDRASAPLVIAEGWFVASTVIISAVLLVLETIPHLRTLVAWALGPAALAFGSIGCIIPMTSLAIWGTRHARLPIIAIGLFSFVLFSLLNDNHRVRSLSGRAQPRPTLQQAYAAWEAHHPNKQDPIVLIATAGGASRAAYWTGTVLRALDDRLDGHFSSSVFAISSVSGGSLGAIGYSAWIADHQPGPPNEGRPASIARARFVQHFFGSDYLGPAVGSLLFPDLVQRFLPVPVVPDRASALEESWELGWTDAIRDCGVPSCGDPHRFDSDFTRIWKNVVASTPSAAAPWVPIVLANGTYVENGKRIITAPIRITPDAFPDSYDFYDLSDGPIRASTAALNSARFPIVSPPGRLVCEGVTTGHIVDGGYFENGGIQTIGDVARFLKHSLNVDRPIIIIEIDNDDRASAADQARYPLSGKVATNPARSVWRSPLLEEVTSIIGGLYQARSARGILAAKQLSDLDASGFPHANALYARFHLPPFGNRHTSMSWALSLSSRDAMDVTFGLVPKWREQIAKRHYGAIRSSKLEQALLSYTAALEARADQSQLDRVEHALSRPKLVHDRIVSSVLSDAR